MQLPTNSTANGVAIATRARLRLQQAPRSTGSTIALPAMGGCEVQSKPALRASLRAPMSDSTPGEYLQRSDATLQARADIAVRAASDQSAVGEH